MKILDEPSKTSWSHEGTCDRCETSVEFSLSDLRFHSDQRDGDAVSWRCPTCGVENWHDVEIVPPHLRYRLG